MFKFQIRKAYILANISLLQIDLQKRSCVSNYNK